MGVGDQHHAPNTLPRESPDNPGPVWMGAENFDLTGIWSPGCPVYSESQYLAILAHICALQVLLLLPHQSGASACLLCQKQNWQIVSVMINDEFH
jgi:hypothetical protein